MFSPLCDLIMRSPNNSGTRTHVIDTITVHHTAGKCTAEQLGDIFKPVSRQASCNYGIGYDGQIVGVVDEENRSWCSSSNPNDQRAITIEVSNDSGAPDWHVSSESMQSLIKLLVDVCRRRGIKRLLWQNNPGLIGQVDKQNMTLHQWFAATACPGPYLISMHSFIAKSVNAILETEENGMVFTQAQWDDMMKTYREALQDNDCGSWSQEARQWAIDNGIILGVGSMADGDANFAWQDFMSREQMVVFLKRFDEYMTKKINEKVNKVSDRLDELTYQIYKINERLGEESPTNEIKNDPKQLSIHLEE